MSTGNKGKHIQLPKSLMTEITGTSDNNNNNGSLPYSRKRKYQNNAKGRMTRKERRKFERDDKKRKLNNNKSKNINTNNVNKKPLPKAEPRIEIKKESEELNIPTDDSLNSDDFDEFDEDDLTKEEWKQLKELEGGDASSSSSSESSSEEEDSEEDSEEDTVIEDQVRLKPLKLKPAIKLKLNKKVITKTQKKHVTFNKKIQEKLIPARENYGHYDVSSEEEEEEDDDDSYLDELDLSDSSDEMYEEKEEEDFEDSDSEYSEDDDNKEMTVEETMAALKAAKDNKNKSLESESDSQEEYMSAEEYISDEDKEMTVEETMAALKAAKEKKNNTVKSESESEEDFMSAEEDAFEGEKEMTVEETMAALKAAKEKKNKSPIPKISKEIEEEIEYPELESDEDERHMRYYAKKLKMNSKSKKLKAMDEYDAIGGLLEGLDFFDDYGRDLEDYGDLEFKDEKTSDSDSEDSDSEGSEESEEIEQSDEEVYDDFDENDLTPEEWKQLRELEDSEADYEDYSSEEEEKPKTKKKSSSKKKQNLYGLDTELDEQDKEIIQNLENDEEQVDEKLDKDVKSLFNKLSETNINNIIASLLDLFNTKSRQVCMNTIIRRILIDCNTNEKLLDQFLMNYIGTVYAIWKFKGVDFGANFIQKLVEKIISFLDTDSTGDDSIAKNGSNLVTLLAYCFNFGIITNKLIYNLLDLFADVSNETSVELILKIISVSGVLLRGENPKDLNNVINKLLVNLEENNDEDDSRLQFLIDTLKDLRLNKIDKNLTSKTNHSNMKKSITKSLKIDSKTLGSNSSQAIQVSLDDILNIDTKGKWWLIGGSYRGNMSTDTNGDNFGEDENIELENDIEFSDIELNDDFIDELPDYNQLAEQNKMSSQLSKAVFVGISSAQDPLDCIMRLDKLNIKKKNYQELLRVLIHVSKLDAQYNPFYEMVIIRLNKNMPGFNKTIKFHFWDSIKNFESNNDEDDVEGILTSLYGEFGKQRDSKIIQEARLFGSLIAHKIIPFDVFKHVPILDGLTVEGELFVNSLIYQLLIKTAKESEHKSIDKNKKKTINYDEDKLHEIVFNSIQQENELIIYKQLQWYLENKFKYSDFKFTTESKKETRRFEWALKTLKNGINENMKYLE